MSSRLEAAPVPPVRRTGSSPTGPTATRPMRSSTATARRLLPPARRSRVLDPDSARVVGCADRRDLGEGSGQAPDIVMSPITRLTPAARIGSQSTSPPTSMRSSSMRCSVEAMVNSRTGAPT